MSKDIVEFKWLEAKPVGTDTVVFQLDDGAKVNIKVDIQRAGVAVNFKNPDGTPHYNIGAGLRITVMPPNRKFFIPRSRIRTDKQGKSEPSSLVV